MLKKVSIITPCYNSEKFLDRYLESVYNQTYKNIELILINDGSTDKTEETIKSWITKFDRKGIKVVYLYKKNGGAASSINEGLKLFSGDYLTWPDSDDILTADSIEKKVYFLEKNLQYAMVRTDANIVKEESIDKIIGNFSKVKVKYKEDLFDDHVLEENVWFVPGCFMIRSDVFLDVNPKRHIYESKGGQNWQILLPVLYNSKCGYIDEALCTYVIRESSHSHSIKSLSEHINRSYEHEDILINTINSMRNMSDLEKEKYLLIIKEKYIRKRIYLGFNFCNKNIVKENYDALSELGLKNKKCTACYIISRSVLINKLVLFGIKIKSKIWR